MESAKLKFIRKTNLNENVKNAKFEVRHDVIMEEDEEYEDSFSDDRNGNRK